MSPDAGRARSRGRAHADAALTAADPSASPTAPALSFEPLWQQVRGLIVRDLEAALWKPGEAIPSELELAARFGVSQGTVRRAIDALADENLLVRRQGKGTFVATHTEEKVSVPRFLRIRRDVRLPTPSAVRSFPAAVKNSPATRHSPGPRKKRILIASLLYV